MKKMVLLLLFLTFIINYNTIITNDEDDMMYSIMQDNLNEYVDTQVNSKKTEIESQLRVELTESIRQELESELRSELTETIKSELETELRTELTTNIRNDLETQLRTEIQEDIQTEMSIIQEELMVQDYTELKTTEQLVMDLVGNNLSSVLGVSNFQRVTGSMTEISTGSGVIIKNSNQDYYLVTNEHVVDKADELKVVTASGVYIDATLIAKDATLDLALLKFTSLEPFSVSPLADSSSVSLGQIGVAIGNPLGYQFYHTVTMGVVSGVDRYVNDVNLPIYIQHDASISPGNSGGPLYDINGQVIGINTLKVTEPDASNLNFAVSSNTVKSFISPYITL